MYNAMSVLHAVIGKLKGYNLHVHNDESVKPWRSVFTSMVKPVSQHMYRIPYSLREKVSNKLDELGRLDIIETVEEPSDWVRPVIVVIKPKWGHLTVCRYEAAKQGD